MASNHTVERTGDGVRFNVRPNSVALWYTYEFVILFLIGFFATDFMIFKDRDMGPLVMGGSAIAGTLLALAVIKLLPSGYKRKRYSFAVGKEAVEMQAPGGPLIRVPLGSLREITIGNTVVGSWHHNMALNSHNPTGIAYAGVGVGGFMAAQGMSLAEETAAASRRFWYNISAGPRSHQSFFVSLRTTSTTYDVGGGLDEQAATDLANDLGRALAKVAA